MSMLPLKPCAVPGCPKLTPHSRCDRHALELEHERGTPKERGYDEPYKALRVPCFARDQWRCVDCGWEPDIVTFYRTMQMGTVPSRLVTEELRRRYHRNERHLHADHVEPIDRRPDLRLDLRNLTTRCNVCHAARTRQQRRFYGPTQPTGRAAAYSPGGGRPQYLGTGPSYRAPATYENSRNSGKPKNAD